MPRNSSGGYTLPVGNPVVSGTVILSTWANPTMADIAAALTDSLDRNGRGGMLAPFLVVDGTIGGPGLAFASQSNVGLFRSASNVLSITSGGIEAAKFSDTAITFLHPVTAPDLTVSGTLTSSATINAAALNVSGALTAGSATITGALTAGSLSGPVHLPDGTTAAPALAFVNDLGTGISRTGGVLTFSGAGAAILQVAPNGIFTANLSYYTWGGSAAVPAYSFGGDRDTGIYQPAPGYLAVVCDGVEQKRWGPGVVDSGVPIGTIVDFAGPNIPQGWFLCDGTAVSRVTYAALFAALGGTWGAGDGVNTFNLPNFVGRTSVGYGQQGVGALGGSSSIGLGVANLPAHNHPVSDPGHGHTVGDPGHVHGIDSWRSARMSINNVTGSWAGSGGEGPVGAQANITAAATGITIGGAGTGITIGNTGSGSPFSVMQPYGVVLKIIKAV